MAVLCQKGQKSAEDPTPNQAPNAFSVSGCHTWRGFSLAKRRTKQQSLSLAERLSRHTSTRGLISVPCPQLTMGNCPHLVVDKHHLVSGFPTNGHPMYFEHFDQPPFASKRREPLLSVTPVSFWYVSLDKQRSRFDEPPTRDSTRYLNKDARYLRRWQDNYFALHVWSSGPNHSGSMGERRAMALVPLVSQAKVKRGPSKSRRRLRCKRCSGWFRGALRRVRRARPLRPLGVLSLSPAPRWSEVCLSRVELDGLVGAQLGWGT